MAIVFYYVNAEDADEILKSGIEILKYSKRIVNIYGKESNCIIGLLNPKDDLLKYNSNEFVCLELDVNVDECFVSDGDLYDLHLQKYNDSIIRLKEYKFGLYRKPEIILPIDIECNRLSIFNKLIGNPILFESSDYLYKSTLFEELRQKYDDFDETILGIFFMLMASKGRFNILGQRRENDKTVYVYKDIYSDKTYSLDIKEGTGNG